METWRTERFKAKLTQERAIPKPQGNLQGLKPGQLAALIRLFKRRFPMTEVYTIEQARELALLSRAMGRQIGLLVDRKGRVGMVLVGTATGIFIPDLPRARTGVERLRGLRLLHTHLTSEGVTTEDIMDMLFLRLDAVIALTVNQEGSPVQWQTAHLLPFCPAGEPWRVESPKSWDRTEARFTDLAENLEAEFARHAEGGLETPEARRALLVSVDTASQSIQMRNLDELADLAQTAGIAVAGRVVQRVRHINPALLLGKGKLAELEVAALQAQASLLIFDGELTPSQLHNLADSTEREVIDRTQLILSIFARHATTKTGKLQVELAQLRYLRPRLAGRRKNMDSLMGGIGGRGPGETKLETDRRRSRERAMRIRHELERIKSRRCITKNRRARSSMPIIALVGYTNAGKTTLLNALTQSQCLVENKLFATLDPAARRMRFPEEKPMLVTDTVGFIRDLPEELKEAFKDTLEEARDADMLVHVADASHPDVLQQIAAVEDILAEPEMGLQTKPVLLLLNKWDALGPEAKAELADSLPRALPLSAKTGKGFRALLQEVERRLAISR
ncbi:MAG: GTPase HflX [Desulfovibrio sp.]|jgi:GTP-binding protein HflX|nr:GTPase HflX [Desulfovibrio sp.]